MSMCSMNREWAKEELEREDILVWNREETNYKIYKHLCYFSLYYMYFLCIRSWHVLRGNVWSCVVEYFNVVILIFKWSLVFKSKLLICTLCIYTEVKVKSSWSFCFMTHSFKRIFIEIPTEMNHMAWSCKHHFSCINKHILTLQSSIVLVIYYNSTLGTTD